MDLRRVGRGVLVGLFSALVVPVIALVVLWVILLSGSEGRRWCERVSAEFMEAALGREVTVGGLRVTPRGSLELERLIVHAGGHRPDSLAVRDMQLRIAVSQLLRGRVVVVGLSIGSCTVHVVRGADGRLMMPIDIPAFRRRAPGGRGVINARLWSKLSIRRAVVRGLELSYVDENDGTAIRFAGGGGTATFGPTFRTPARLRLFGGNLRTPWWNGAVHSVSGEGCLQGAGVAIRRLSADCRGVALWAEGMVPATGNGYWDLRFEADASVEHLAFLRASGSAPAGRGIIGICGSVVGAVQRPSLALTLAASDLTFDRYGIDSLRLQAAFDGDSSISATGTAWGPIGTAILRGKGILMDSSSQPHLGAYEVEVELPLVRAATLVDRAAHREAVRGMTLWIKGAAEGRGTRRIPDRLQVRFGARGGALQGGGLRGWATLDSCFWAMHGAYGGALINGEGRYADDTIDGRWSAKIVDTVELPGVAIAPDSGGGLFLEGRLGGGLLAPWYSADLHGAGVGGGGIVLDSLSGRLEGRGGHIDLREVEVRFRGNMAEIADNLALGPLSGMVQATVRASGSPASPRLSAEVAGTMLGWGGREIESLSGTVALRGDTLMWGGVNLQSGTTLIRSGGTVVPGKHGGTSAFCSIHSGTSAPRRSSGRVEIEGMVGLKRSHLWVRMDSTELSAFRPWVRGDTLLDGVMSAVGELGHDATGVHGRIHVGLSRPRVGGLMAAAMEGEAIFDGKVSRVRSRLHLCDSISTIDITASVPIGILGRRNGGIERGREFMIHAVADSVPMAALTGSLHEQLRGTGGWISFDVSCWADGGTGRIAGSVSGERVGFDYLPQNAHIGNASFEGVLGGTVASPRLTVLATAEQVRLRSFVIDSSHLAWSVRNDSLIVSTATAYLQGGGTIRLEGAAALDSVRGGDGRSPGDLRFALSNVPLTILEPLMPEVTVSGGVIRGSGGIGFRMARPVVRGMLAIENGTFRIPGVETVIGPVRGSMALRNDSIVVAGVRATVGEGLVEVRGWITLGSPVPRAELQFSAAEPSLYIPDLASLSVRSGKLRLRSDGGEHRLEGDVALGETWIVRDIWLPDLLVPAGERKFKMRNAGGGLEKLILGITLDLGQNLHLDIDLAQLVLGGTVVLTGMAADPLVRGTVEIVEGGINYLDRRFRVSGGRLRYSGSPVLNPTIGISAVTEVDAVVPQFSGELPGTESYEIALAAGGPLRNPEITLTSKPALSEADIVSVLTLGTTLGAVGTDLGERVQAVAANQLLGFGARRLEHLLGLEDVRVTGVESGSGVEEGPHITLTKRLSDRLTVSYATAVRTLDPQEVSAVYRLSRFLFLVGSRDKVGTSTIDLKFRLTW